MTFQLALVACLSLSFFMNWGRCAIRAIQQGGTIEVISSFPRDSALIAERRSSECSVGYCLERSNDMLHRSLSNFSKQIQRLQICMLLASVSGAFKSIFHKFHINPNCNWLIPYSWLKKLQRIYEAEPITYVHLAHLGLYYN